MGVLGLQASRQFTRYPRAMPSCFIAGHAGLMMICHTINVLPFINRPRRLE